MVVDFKHAPPALKLLGAVTLFVFLASGISMIVVEEPAFEQHNRPTLEYTQPMKIKGVVRYVTLMQERIDRLADWGLMGSMFVGVICIAANMRIDARRKNSRTDQ